MLRGWMRVPMKAKVEELVSIKVPEMQFGRIEVHMVGLTPLICNRMSEKAKRELLAPKGRKTAAERAAEMKHDPVQEFRDSMERMKNERAIIAVPASAFKGVLMTAALDVPGAYKTQVGRLVWVKGYKIPIYGVPKLYMSVVRSADMNKTPDIRTRALLPEWACRVDVEFTMPLVNEQTILNLLHMGGRTAGVGDFRAEKGKGDFGQFRICNADDPEFLRIAADGGAAVQEAAIEAAEPFDADSAELLAWYRSEVQRRGKGAGKAGAA